MLTDEYFGQQFEKLYKAKCCGPFSSFQFATQSVNTSLFILYYALGIPNDPKSISFREDFYRLYKYYHKRQPSGDFKDLDRTKLYTTNLNIYEHSISRNQ